MRIVLAELAPARGDRAVNLGRVETLAGQGLGELIVFPELFVSGYRVGDRVHGMALHPDGPELRRLGEAARRGRTAIVVGAPVAREGRSGEVENTCLLIRPDGTVARQAKRHLPTYGPFEEGKVYSPTATSVPVDLAGLRVGAAICYDAFFPEVFRELALDGATLFVVISAAPVTSGRLFDKVLPARAVENACPLVYVNRVGVEDGLVFGGGSVALDARGERLPAEELGRELGDAEHLWRVELDPTEAPRWRPMRPVLRDRASRPVGQLSTPTSAL